MVLLTAEVPVSEPSYHLVNNGLLLKMTIEIVDFPIKQWWIFPVRYVSHYQAGYIQRGREMGSSSKQLDSHGWILLDSRT